MFCFCSIDAASPLNRGRRRSRRLKAEQGAVSDNDTALERREAPGPTSLGQRARKRQPLVTGDLPWRAADPEFGFANRRRSAGGASRRSIPREREKENREDGPARVPELKPRGEEACLLRRSSLPARLRASLTRYGLAVASEAGPLCCFKSESTMRARAGHSGGAIPPREGRAIACGSLPPLPLPACGERSDRHQRVDARLRRAMAIRVRGTLHESAR
jgi:hypothetical protein